MGYCIQTEHYLLNDYIINKKDIGGEVYFIKDGKVSIIGSNEQDVLYELKDGESGLFLKCNRICYAQAKTHCTICLLKRSAIEEVTKRFSEVEQSLKEYSNRLCKELQELDKKFLSEEKELVIDKDLINVNRGLFIKDEGEVNDRLKKEVELTLLKSVENRVAISKGRRSSNIWKESSIT